ncbi:MAG: hypothetical protein H7070_15215 [Saprospiraceae bacterium]|nr:hypothetical protein [Pyrinomonadaceae bacterium]
MFNKTASLMLAGLLLNMALATPAYAGPKEKDARFAEKVKQGIARLGTGESARVEVKLRDKTKLKGFVKEAGSDSFTVADAKTGVETRVAYSNTKQIKGHNLSTGAKIAIGLAILAGVLAIFLFFENYG